MGYKVGDIVRIRKDLTVGVQYNDLTLFGGSMADLRGKEQIITEIDAFGTIKCNNLFWWKTEMIEPVTVRKRTLLEKIKDFLKKLIGGE